MSIRQRGKTWQVDVKVHAEENPTGSPVRVRVAFATEREAVRNELLIRADVMRSGRWNPEGSAGGDAPIRKAKAQHTLKDALALAWDHTTHGWVHAKDGKGQLSNAKAVVSFLGESRLCSDVTRRDYERAAEYLRDVCYNSNDTITRKLQAMHRVLWFAEDREWILARPKWNRPPPGVAREFVFSRELEAQTIAYFRAVEGEPEMADLFQFGIETGARLGELIALRMEDVLLDASYVRIFGKVQANGRRSTKTGESRTVILTDVSKEVYQRRLKAVGSRGLMFPAMTSEKVSREMRMAREALGHEGNREFTFHATRHTCGTRMAEQRVPLNDMMDQLGHGTVAMTRRYTKLSPAARRETILAHMQGAPGI